MKIHPGKPGGAIGLLAIALASTLAFSSLDTSSSSAAQLPRKILTGWIPYYGMKTALPAAIANGDLIREVMPFWYTLKGESVIADLYTPANPSVAITTPLATMRNAGFKIIPTITDGTTTTVLANLLANKASRTQIVKTITNLVMTNNFDGIDLDFEGFAFVDPITTWPTTRPNWVAFVQELSTSLHAQDKILSMTTPILFEPNSGKKGYYVYDWASIAPMIDRLRIMTYDYSTSVPGPIGPLPWIEETLQYAISVVPASKIYIGVAGYGRDWVTKVVGICPDQFAKAIMPTAKAATFVMRDAPALIASYGAVPVYAEVSAEVTFTYDKVYSGVNAQGKTISCTASRRAWYQDARSYTARAKLVEKYHIAGLTAWTLGMESVDATEAIRQIAYSIAPEQVINTLSVDQAAVPYAGAVIVKGEFRLADKQPIAGLSVRLETRGAEETAWREILTTTTDLDGNVLVPLLLSTSSSLRFSTDGTWEKLASVSPWMSVTLSRRIAITPPTSSPINVNFDITGVVEPHQSDVVLKMEKFVNGAWATIGTGAVTNSSGAFVISGLEKSRGLARLRITIVGDSKFEDSQSPIFNLVIY